MSIELPIGTYDDALAMVGHETEPVVAEVPIEEGLVKALAGLVEDPNPAYWSHDFACEHWGFPIAPPAVLMCLFTALFWHPDRRQANVPLAVLVPLPGTSLINVSTDTAFTGPLRVGDRLQRVERVSAVSGEKSTKLGRGHFVTTVATYRNQRDGQIAEATNVMLRFTPASEDRTAR